ncbi:MAG: hypothetical protein P8130_14170 [Deltaproteobacteria bacterium]
MEQAYVWILSAVYCLSVIVLCLIDKIRIASSLILLSLSVYPLVIGLVYQYAFPSTEVIGKADPSLPYGIGGLLLVLFALSFTVKSSPKTNRPPSPMRWVLLYAGIALYLLSVIVPLVFFYSPDTFGYEKPMPMLGVIAHISLIAVSTILFYLASTRNSRERPNLMRKIILLLAYLVFFIPTITLSLILIYAFPGEPETSYPTAASINLLAVLFWGVTVFFIGRDATAKLARNQQHGLPASE